MPTGLDLVASVPVASRSDAKLRVGAEGRGFQVGVRLGFKRRRSGGDQHVKRVERQEERVMKDTQTHVLIQFDIYDRHRPFLCAEDADVSKKVCVIFSINGKFCFDSS